MKSIVFLRRSGDLMSRKSSQTRLSHSGKSNLKEISNKLAQLQLNRTKFVFFLSRAHSIRWVRFQHRSTLFGQELFLGKSRRIDSNASIQTHRRSRRGWNFHAERNSRFSVRRDRRDDFVDGRIRLERRARASTTICNATTFRIPRRFSS